MSLLGMSQTDLLGAIAQRVRAARLGRGWSQEEIASRAGIPLPTYRLFERTGRIASPALIRVAAALGRLSEFDGLFQARPTSLDQVVGQQSPGRKRGKTLR